MVTQNIQRELVREVVRDIAVTDSTNSVAVWDFVQQGFVGNGLNFSRSSAAGCYNSSGVWTSLAADVPRIDYHPTTLQPRGLLIEEGRTNYLRNSTAPATQTITLTAGSYILWVVGTGNCAVTAGTAVGTGFGTATASTTLSFTITTAGTVVFTVSGTLSQFQCENGTSVTSFITTTTSSVSRSADVCSIALGSGYNSAEGTFIIECSVGASSTIALGVDDGAGGTSNRAHITAGVNSRQYFVSIAGVSQASITHVTSLVLGNVVKMAATYSNAAFMYAVNGELVGTTAKVSDPLPVTTARLGCRFLPSPTGFLNGYIRKLTYHPKALSSEQIRQLTL